MKIYETTPSPNSKWDNSTYLVFAKDKEEAIKVVKGDVYKDITGESLNEISSKEDAVKFVEDWGAKVDDEFYDQFNDLETSRVFAVLRKESTYEGHDYLGCGYY